MMNFTRLIKGYVSYGLMALVVLGASGSLRAATAVEAEAITASYEGAEKLWMSELRLAPDDHARRMIMAKRPSAADYATRLKKLLARDLASEWTLKYGAWLLENDPGMEPESQRALLNAVEKHHLKSPELGGFCIAMASFNEGAADVAGRALVRHRGIQLLEKIKKTNPHITVQGQAALAISMVLSTMGEDQVIMKQRLINIREAVVKSADVKMGNVTVAEIVKEELYKISNLSTGREAPGITGIDSASRPVRLSSYRGKVVMLVFWSSWDKDSIKVLDILAKMQKGMEMKPFAILGINRDDFMTLRRVEAESMVAWKNISDPKNDIAKKYRISSTPYCMVLDQAGIIRYRGNVGSFANAVAEGLLSVQAPTPAHNR